MKRLLFLCLMLITIPLQGVNIFQDFEDLKPFKKNSAKNSLIEFKSVKGYKGKGVRIDFDLTKDHWVEIGRKAEIKLDNIHEFSWFLKGNGNGNVFEIKFVDEDGTTFGTKLPISGIKEGEWKKITLSKRDLHYMWGGNKSLDKVQSFHLAVSRGLAKKGYIIIDEFGYSEKTKGEPDFTINFNQVGYHPTDLKFFIVRIYDVNKNDKLSGSFKIKNTKNKTVYSGKLKNIAFSDWKGRFLKGSFDKLQKKGQYTIDIKLKTKRGIFSKKSYSFKINDTVFSTETLPAQLNYLQYQRCGIKCHKNDPVMGGYHDTFFDISKRMWSIPALVYGMAIYCRDGAFHPDNNNNNISDDLEELLWGLRFITEMPESDGTVSWGGIEADFRKVMTYEQFLVRLGPLKPEDDDLPRKKYKDKNFYSTAYNLIALISSIPAVKKQNKKLADEAEEVAFNTWKWLDKQFKSEARAYGFYLWAATELYEYTGEKKYLYKVKDIVPKLLKLQALNYRQFENNACGDFYTSRYARDFKYQYKYVSFNMAINMALLNLCKILPKDNALWFDIYYANKVFGENYLKGIASKTPYCQAAHGLELQKKGNSAVRLKKGWEVKRDFSAFADLDYKNKAGTRFLCLNFDLNKGSWIHLKYDINTNLKELNKIRIQYKYTGKKNKLEIKIIDKEGSTFGYRKLLTPADNWITEKIDISKCQYWWGGDNKLDLSNIKSLWIGISRDDGGTGSLYLKEAGCFTNEIEIFTLPIDNPDLAMCYYLSCFAGPEAKSVAADNHGLNCDHFGLAFIALKWAQYINDLELEEMADNQVNWFFGTNPLNYSMMIGVGSKNPVIMAEYYDKPKVKGTIPNGIVGGENEEPEWWGDSPSSGEGWLPHNAAYLALLSIIDNKAEIQGRVLLNGKSVSKAVIEIYDKKKKVAKESTDNEGRFNSIILIPQKQYKIIISKGKRKIIEKINLVSGSKKNLVWDLNRNFTVRIIPPKKINIGKKNIFTVKLPKKAVGMSYRIRIKGAEIRNKAEGKIRSRKMKLIIMPDGDKPLLLRFEIKGVPLIVDELYYSALL